MTRTYVPVPRICTCCGAVDQTVFIVTTCGDRICRGCWAMTTQGFDVRQPPTPTLDRLMARAERAARGQR
jgi:hypothetical protein